MKFGIAALNDTQRLVLASGKALAEELGLKEFSRPMKEFFIRGSDADIAFARKLGLTEASYMVPSDDIGLTEGQTALIASPLGTNVGVIRVEVDEGTVTRNTEYHLNDEVLFRKSERLIAGEWGAGFSADLNIPSNSTLYVS
jgi:hypothetical protein